MAFLNAVIQSIFNHFNSHEIPTALIVAVLVEVALLSIYEYVIYSVVLRRSLYNRAFNIAITLIPFFISTIILCLQSNLVITLGTIGALAIIRFRTAVKDPIDMIFLLWSIHIGIVCGCQLYELAVAVSLVVTVVLIILNYVSIGRKTHLLILNLLDSKRLSDIETVVKETTSKYKIKSRNFSGNGLNVLFEITGKDLDALTEKMADYDFVERFSLMEYDSEDVI